MPKYDYYKVLESLEQELRVLPAEVQALAYEFKELIVKHYAALTPQYKKKLSIRFPFKAGKSRFGGDNINVKYTIEVCSRTEPCLDQPLKIQTLKIYVKSRFGEKDQWEPINLPWDKA